MLVNGVGTYMFGILAWHWIMEGVYWIVESYVWRMVGGMGGLERVELERQLC